MRIADIVQTQLRQLPQAALLDATRASAHVQRYVVLTPELKAKYRQVELDALGVEAKTPEVWLMTVPTDDDRRAFERALERCPDGTRVVLLDAGGPTSARRLVELTSRAGIELEGAYGTNHAALPRAAAGKKVGNADLKAAETVWIRNEHLLGDLERRDLKARTEALEADLALVTDAALKLEKEVHQLEKENEGLSEAQRRYERARGSVSYRLGYAQVLALKKPGMNTLKLPLRVARAFRSKDGPEIVAPKAAPKPQLAQLARGRPNLRSLLSRNVDLGAREVETAFLLAGTKPPPPQGWCGFVGSASLGAELSELSPVVPLGPHDGRLHLGRSKPAFVLVEAGLTTAPGPWSLLEQRPHAQLEAQLRALLDLCVDRGIPVVLWDGGGMAAVIRELEPRFDAVFSSRPTGAQRGLPVGVSAPIDYPWNGEGDGKLAFVGGFDRGLPEAKLLRLIELLDAAADRLVIYDDGLGEAASRTSLPERFRDKVVGRIGGAEVAPYRRHSVYAFGACSGPEPRADRRVSRALAAGRAVLLTDTAGFEGLPVRRFEGPESVRAAFAAPPPRLGMFLEHGWARRLMTMAEAVGRSGAPFSPSPLHLTVKGVVGESLVEGLRGQIHRPAAVVGSVEEEVGAALAELGIDVLSAEVGAEVTGAVTVPATDDLLSHPHGTLEALLSGWSKGSKGAIR